MKYDNEFDKREKEFIDEGSKNIFQYWLNEITRVTIYKKDDKFTIARSWVMGHNIALSIDAQDADYIEVLKYVSERPRKMINNEKNQES